MSKGYSPSSRNVKYLSELLRLPRHLVSCPLLVLVLLILLLLRLLHPSPAKSLSPQRDHVRYVCIKPGAHAAPDQHVGEICQRVACHFSHWHKAKAPVVLDQTGVIYICRMQTNH